MTQDNATIAQGPVKVAFDLAGGKFDIEVGSFSLSGMQAGFEHADGTLAGSELNWQLLAADDDSLSVAGSAADLTLKLTFAIRPPLAHASTPALEISAEVSGKAPFTLERIIVLDGGGMTSPDWIFINGRKGGATGTFPGDADREFNSEAISCWTAGGESLFFTAPAHQPLPSVLQGKVEGGKVAELQFVCNVELDDISPSVSAPPLTLCVTERPHDYLEAYGDRQRTDDMRPIGPVPIAWNSWDYILDLVSEEYILKHLDLIDNDPVLREKIEYIIIDCGWQHLFGEWEANYRFPHGMEWLAKQITDRGYKAGLWFCPVVFENCSTMCYWNDHLAAQGKGRYPCVAWQCMRRYGIVLDIENPEAKQWLFDLFARYRKMGYTYFKLDFLRHVANAYYYGGKRVPKGELVRKVVETVREAVGPECHIMGCNHPTGAGPGVIDSCRVSGDVRPRWAFVKRNALSTSSKYWQHNRLWVNDPDFALCRGCDTSDDPDIDRMHNMDVYVEVDHEEINPPVMSLSLIEARTLLSVIILSGGSVALSDDLTLLNEVGMDLARKTVTAEIGEDSRPVDLFTAEYASLWTQKLPSGGARIGAINWSDEPVSRAIDVRDLTGLDAETASEYWTEEQLTIADGKIELELAPHETKLLEIRL